jgi:hypothetical protein
MHGSTIFAIGFLGGELGIRIFSSYCGAWYEVPKILVCFPLIHSGQAEVVPTISSVC